MYILGPLNVYWLITEKSWYHRSPWPCVCMHLHTHTHCCICMIIDFVLDLLENKMHIWVTHDVHRSIWRIKTLSSIWWSLAWSSKVKWSISDHFSDLANHSRSIYDLPIKSYLMIDIGTSIYNIIRPCTENLCRSTALLLDKMNYL